MRRSLACPFVASSGCHFPLLYATNRELEAVDCAVKPLLKCESGYSSTEMLSDSELSDAGDAEGLYFQKPLRGSGRHSSFHVNSKKASISGA